jgi:hypothetical protein
VPKSVTKQPESSKKQRPKTAKKEVKTETTEGDETPAAAAAKKDAEDEDYEQAFEEEEGADPEKGTDKKPKKEGEEEKKEEESPEAEEDMLDVAENCFIKIAELMITKSLTIRQIFAPFSVPEQFPDGSIIELLTPISFLEGVKTIGLTDLTQLEAACILRVLSKPELDNAVILNELVLIMENFGVIENYEEEEESDDEIDEEETPLKTEGKADILEGGEAKKDEDKTADGKKKLKLDFESIDEKALKILAKLARFLLQRYMHPREFFGPAIYKQLVKTKKMEKNIDVMQTKDFYLRLKLASIRKTVKENDSLNKFLCLGKEHTNLFNVKKVVKSLEEVAQGEQAKLQEEMKRIEA